MLLNNKINNNKNKLKKKFQIKKYIILTLLYIIAFN